MTMETIAATNAGKESFAALFEDSMRERHSFEGTVVSGTIVGIDGEWVTIDIGLKAEGRVQLREFAQPGQDVAVNVGDLVEVFVDRVEDRQGEARLSREKARREEAWTQLEKSFADKVKVSGVIINRVKGGFTVDLGGAHAFLPGSQVDIRPVKDVAPLFGTPQPFQILKMDRQRGNIVVSRRAVLEETRAEARSEIVSTLQEDMIITGVVKNIVDYGAFVDLGGIDGLLHVTDIAWRRINHPSEALQVGQSVRCKVTKFDRDKQRISLGMKQLEANPWDGVELRYPKGAKFSGKVTNIADYGAFVELEPGIEGLVHVTEMSWTKKNVHPNKIVQSGQEVEVVILDVDQEKRRVSLGLKQTLENPWESFISNYPAGSNVEGEVKNSTEFGLFLGLPGDIDGMVHLSELSWEKTGEEAIKDYKRGDKVTVKVLDVDVDDQRISLGIKQVAGDPFEDGIQGLKRHEIVTTTVTGVTEGGLEISVNGTVPGFIRRAELSRERSEQRPDRYAVGEKIDAKIMVIDRAQRRLQLSIKAKEVEDEKQAMAEFGSAESGASLGEILGAALRKAQTPGKKDE